MHGERNFTTLLTFSCFSLFTPLIMPASSQASDFDSESPRVSDTSQATSDYHIESSYLRGLRWRVLLGVLPPPPAPIEGLRRAAADGRRMYAELRRRLIVDPHVTDDGLRGENFIVDNPLSRDPGSIWGRYFRNTEIQKIIESDLAQLYPEHGSFFQSCSCQAMLKRILLVWALVHPEYGYHQGMHEVLFPLVHVLHADVTYLELVKQRYGDPFEDRFDTPFEENYSRYKQVVASAPAYSSLLSSKEVTWKDDEEWIERVHPDDLPLLEPDDFGFSFKTMILGSDNYGAEGELGALLSGRFMEHDVYCLFDALMGGKGGAVKLADYYMPLTEAGVANGVSPALEALSAIYRALAMVDMPLYIHLVGLSIEPQFFALRWLRVLFGREFELDKLLLLWDAVFAAPSNGLSEKDTIKSSHECRSPPDGTFISTFAVSMLIHLRLALLASSNATNCLQKLLNFPKNVDIRSLVENAKVLRSLSEDQMGMNLPPSPKYVRPSRGNRYKSGSHSPPFQPYIPSPIKVLRQRHVGCPHDMMQPSSAESYWENRWVNSVLSKGVPVDIQHLQASEKDTFSVCLSGNKTPRSDMVADASSRHDDSIGVCRELPGGLREEVSIKETASAISCGSLPSSPEASSEHHFIDSINGMVYDGVDVCCVSVVEGDGHHDEIRDPDDLHDQSMSASTAVCGSLSEEVYTNTKQNLKLTGLNDVLQTLGESMTESIQILESAITQKTLSSEALSKTLLNGNGHVSALSAIAELRRISNLLLEM